MESDFDTNEKQQHQSVNERAHVAIKIPEDPALTEIKLAQSALQSTCTTGDMSSAVSASTIPDEEVYKRSSRARTALLSFAHVMGSNVAFAQIIASIISFIDYNVEAGAENWCEKLEYPSVTNWRSFEGVEFETVKDCIAFSYHWSWMYDGLPALTTPVLVTVAFFGSFARRLSGLPFGTAAYVVSEINHRRSQAYKISISFCIFACMVSFLASALTLRSRSGALPMELFYHGFLILLAFRQLLQGSFRRPLDVNPCSLARLLMIRVNYGMFEHPENMLDRTEHALLRYGALLSETRIPPCVGDDSHAADVNSTTPSSSREQRMVDVISDVVDVNLSKCFGEMDDSGEDPLMSVSSFAYLSLLATFTNDYEAGVEAANGVDLFTATLSYWFGCFGVVLDKRGSMT